MTTRKASSITLKGTAARGFMFGMYQDRIDKLETALKALMTERRALRSYAAALGMNLPWERKHELGMEHLRLEKEARTACAAAGFRL